VIHPYFNVTGPEAKGLLYGLLEMSKDQLRANPGFPSMRQLVQEGKVRYRESDPNEHWQTYREIVEKVGSDGVAYADCEDLATAVAAEDQVRYGIESIPYAYSPRQGLFHVVTAVPSNDAFRFGGVRQWPPAAGAKDPAGFVLQDISAAAGMPTTHTSYGGLVRGKKGNGMFRQFTRGLLGGQSASDVARDVGVGVREGAGLGDGFARELGASLVRGPSAAGVDEDLDLETGETVPGEEDEDLDAFGLDADDDFDMDDVAEAVDFTSRSTSALLNPFDGIGVADVASEMYDRADRSIDRLLAELDADDEDEVVEETIEEEFGFVPLAGLLGAGAMVKGAQAAKKAAGKFMLRHKDSRIEKLAEGAKSDLAAGREQQARNKIAKIEELVAEIRRKNHDYAPESDVRELLRWFRGESMTRIPVVQGPYAPPIPGPGPSRPELRTRRLPVPRPRVPAPAPRPEPRAPRGRMPGLDLPRPRMPKLDLPDFRRPRPAPEQAKPRPRPEPRRPAPPQVQPQPPKPSVVRPRPSVVQQGPAAVGVRPDRDLLVRPPAKQVAPLKRKSVKSPLVRMSGLGLDQVEDRDDDDLDILLAQLEDEDDDLDLDLDLDL
jgi:hypothetical protein